MTRFCLSNRFPGVVSSKTSIVSTTCLLRREVLTTISRHAHARRCDSRLATADAADLQVRRTITITITS